ncbi:uncharacterized protein LAESUDRAFT_429686 [Laetiporus sulphureus 93-53]|uniref:Uncharacterized protein n=1 Tax=Laetiporus sulphureus 93-53 TaxID=1314785 RepID=A0A165GMB2_9APHY|nr:uncharacterized protein LAESUDRAFT_429686 [Laetiporus sulphureus 93-53]KZT10549.1 hypothetical protein LAESUDRAFT_429686 [Laetiporus sulphureus 93-53]
MACTATALLSAAFQPLMDEISLANLLLCRNEIAFWRTSHIYASVATSASSASIRPVQMMSSSRPGPVIREQAVRAPPLFALFSS